MGEQYRVDLHELDSVVRKLKSLQGDMDEPSQKVKYSTSIPKSAFGSNFNEAAKIATAHDEMQNYMSQVVDASRAHQGIRGEGGAQPRRVRGPRAGDSLDDVRLRSRRQAKQQIDDQGGRSWPVGRWTPRATRRTPSRSTRSIGKKASSSSTTTSPFRSRTRTSITTGSTRCAR